VTRVVTRVVTCREFVEFLDAYLSGSLPEAERASFNDHLAQCPSCVAYMKTYQLSVRLGRAALTRSEDPVAGKAPEKLIQAILAARHKP
jgi:anti-sigma factor RsiW